jgi:DNA-binding response OmpR family regulator
MGRPPALFSWNSIMPQGRILVIEDDAAIRRGIVDALTFEGYQVRSSGDGPAGQDLAMGSDCDLVLLDLVLPGRDGLDILREVRISRPTLPVIVLTARGDEGDRVRGLRLGADDYVVKPFSVRELLARVEAVLRRSPERPTDVTLVRFPGGQADMSRCEARFDDGQRIELSERERDLLRYLASHAGRAIAREEILSHVWRINPTGVTTRTIDMHVARLREKLRDDPAAPAVIVTVRGKGYMWGCTDKNGGDDRGIEN